MENLSWHRIPGEAILTFLYAVKVTCGLGLSGPGSICSEGIAICGPGSPNADHPFYLNESRKLISEQSAETFHLLSATVLSGFQTNSRTSFGLFVPLVLLWLPEPLSLEWALAKIHVGNS